MSFRPQCLSILDDSLGIDSQISADKVLLYEKDTNLPLLKDFDNPFSVNVDLYEETTTYEL